jgi:hypothetical protein
MNLLTLGMYPQCNNAKIRVDWVGRQRCPTPDYFRNNDIEYCHQNAYAGVDSCTKISIDVEYRRKAAPPNLHELLVNIIIVFVCLGFFAFVVNRFGIELF